MNRKKIYLICITVFLFLSASIAHATSLSLSPSSGTFYKGENFHVNVLINADTSINAVSGTLSFPTRYFKVLSVDKTDSIINLWTLEPSFSNAGDLGNVVFEGIILNPGFKGSQSKVIGITLSVEAPGSANLRFLKSSILANDGLGTNVSDEGKPASFILEGSRPAPSPVGGAAKELSPPQIVVIREVPQETGNFNLPYIWDILPAWIRAVVLISVGIISLIFSLVVISFGIIVLIWMWSNLWHRREKFIAFLKLLVNMSKHSVFWVFSVGKTASVEIKGDMRYSIEQFKIASRHARQPQSLNHLLKDFYIMTGNIMKRFFTMNITKEREEQKEWTSRGSDDNKKNL